VSKNITDQDSYLNGWNGKIKTVAFGNGEIKIGTASWPDNHHVLIIADTETSHQIGSYEKDPDASFFHQAKEVICLGFNKPESIDVVIDFLNEIKAAMKVCRDKETKSDES
jgi:hypothetical protein